MAKSFKSAWVKQCPIQVETKGKDNAAWYVHWKEPDGRRRSKSFGTGATGKKYAEREAERIRAKLLTGTYEKERVEIAWMDFCRRYDEKVLKNLQPTSRKEIIDSLKRFTKHVKPLRLSSITAETFADFIAKRRKDRGRKPGSRVSPATVNKDLRHVKGALRMAVDWEYLDKVSRFKMLREPQKLPKYVDSEHFAAMYEACDVATLPGDLTVLPADWWRGLLVMAQMTGRRIGELLALRWTDVDLDAGFAITRHRDNKGHRDDKVPLHAVVVEHLQAVKSFEEMVFPWSPHRRTLDSQFARIQDAAGIHLPCPDAGDPEHGECTPACHRYSFHDERRAFATMNAEHMTREALQKLMRHRSPDTTDRYINMARQLNPAVGKLHVPNVLRKAE